MSPRKAARQKVSSAKRVLVKIGSRALVNKRGRLDRKVFESVASDVATLVESGKLVALVSSGAILAGRSRLGLLDKSLTMPKKQAAAAVGQHELMQEWAKALKKHGLTAGQVLITTEDMGNRIRFLNSRNTIEELFALGVVPVINENDTVAVEEIRYGDNDQISTLVMVLMDAELLVILTDIDGFYSKDPTRDKNAEIISEVSEDDEELFSCAGPSKSGVGSGGMATKIEAARRVARKGVPTIIANAKTEHVVSRIVDGELLGTLFVPTRKPITDRKYWLGFAGHVRGAVVVDEGAQKAVTERKKSLLPTGVTDVLGQFKKGDLIRVMDKDRAEIARGLTQYSSADVKKIMGKKTGEIESVLGQMLYEEIVHRDYMFLIGEDR